ncbi:MAG TPA: YcxB family protein [Phycisphaerae bacterium]|nr:YcxB family protein [Phycisphaerae bacterium]
MTDAGISSLTPPSPAGAAAEGESISVEFTLDDNDILALQNHYLKSSPERQKFNLFFRIMLVITALIAAADLALVVQGDRVATEFGTWVVLFFVLWTYLLYRARGASAQSLQRALKEGKNRLLFSQQRLTISREGIEFTSPYGNSNFKWGAIEKVRRAGNYIFFYCLISAYVVPRRAFRTELDFQHFFEAAQRLHRTASPGNCRKCGYDLYGNESGACPECGTPIVKSG